MKTPPQDPTPTYLVTAFKHLKTGDVFGLDLRVCVSQPIEWVRQHADEIAAYGVEHDEVARKITGPIVALNVAAA